MSTKTFLDESGTHAGSRVVTVAGFVVPEAALPLLEAEWREQLELHELRELHMREFVPPHGKCSNWSPDVKRTFLASLIAIVHRHTTLAVGAAVEIDEFMKHAYQLQMERYRDLVLSPYSWCMRYCVAQVGDWCRKSEAEGPVDYVMDRGNAYRSEAERSFASAKEDPDLVSQLYLGSLEFRDSDNTIALQCADLLAYEMYKEADRRLSGAARGPRGSFVALLRQDDRLMTITPASLRRNAMRPAAMTFAIAELLPAREKFQVYCYGLRAIPEHQREALFEVMPAWREVYAMCLQSGEMGKRLDDLPPEVLPPDDPDVLMPILNALLGDDDESHET